MKKLLCILFAVLFAFSTISVPALAADGAEILTDDEDVLAIFPDEADNKPVVVGAKEGVPKEDSLPSGYWVEYTWTDDYNKPIKAPKGGRIEWRWQTLGGRVSIEQNTTYPYKCIVNAESGGWVHLDMRLLDANEKEIGANGILIHVGHSGFGLFLNTITGGMYDSVRFDLFIILYKLNILPYHYK